jgi:hypothetical protein
MHTLPVSDGRLDPPAPALQPAPALEPAVELEPAPALLPAPEPAPAREPARGTTAGALSLDRKLAAIAQDRAVLHLLRDLADRGLREGDPVRHRATGVQGRLVVERTAMAPRILVWPDRSGDLPLPAGDLASWQRR